MNRNRHQGIALVSTLIMLSIVTFIAVTFLALTRRERASVIIQQQQIGSREAAGSAVERAMAELISRMLSSSNRYSYEPLVSLNIDGAANVAAFVPLSALTNLQFDARVPVYIYTNSSGPVEYPYYLDFNRSGTNEAYIPGLGGDPEWIAILEDPTRPHDGDNRALARYAFYMLPAGKSLDLNSAHNHVKGAYDSIAPNADGFLRNHGMGPWEFNQAAFLADLNTNIWYPTLADYNYDIQTNGAGGFLFANSGRAFDAAGDLLRRRYLGNFNNLSNFFQIYGTNASIAYTNDFLGGAGVAPLMRVRTLPTGERDNAFYPWSGAPNPNPFFDLADWYDTNNVYHGLRVSHPLLQVALTNSPSAAVNEYNHYTFYRWIAQQGTDSGLPPQDKIHINYDNKTSYNGQTNWVDWTAESFFRYTADSFLRKQVARSLSVDTNPPSGQMVSIYPTNEYPGEVHRLIQVAANLYDATRTNRYNPAAWDTNYFPSVFRPTFLITNAGTTTNVMLLSYIEETNALNALVAGNFYSALGASQIPIPAGTNSTVATNIYVYGVPVIIAARQGFPNFNEYVSQTSFEITRKMEIQKQSTNQPPIFTRTNTMLLVGITNNFSIEGWNSLTSTYPRNLRVYTSNSVSATLTATNGLTLWPALNVPASPVTFSLPLFLNNMLANTPTAGGWTMATNTMLTWLGWNVSTPTNSFRVWSSPYKFMGSNQQFYVNPIPPYGNHFYPVTSVTNFEFNAGFPVPEWRLNITNTVQYLAVDDVTGRILDFVFLNDLVLQTNITDLLMNDPNSEIVELWRTNRLGNSASTFAPTLGHQRQISISEGNVTTTPQFWTSYTLQPTTLQQKNNGIDTFRRFRGLPPLYNPATPYPTGTNMQTPFNPTVKMSIRKTWQANDPLVHYTTVDLTDNMNVANYPASRAVLPPTASLPASNARQVNERYQPWGVTAPTPNASQSGFAFSELHAYDWMLKDSLITGSDAWNFPAQKFGNVGWLGRVHRGTPWQTVYLKAAQADPADWVQWSASSATHPTNDWLLVDHFTTSPDYNVSAGLLSANQTNLAAWSAALSGLLVLTNTDLTGPTNTFLAIEPNSPALLLIHQRINQARTNLTAQLPSGVFTNLGQILATPELSVGFTNAAGDSVIGSDLNGRVGGSPYLDFGVRLSGAQPQSDQEKFAIGDDMYERIPQQLLSLLKIEENPRVVIYAFGQSLKPAPRSVVVAPGPTRGICTNYQVTGEVVIRAVVRVEGSFLDPVNNPPRTVIESYNVLRPTDY
jgi:hypothetical protein